ncbi:hypothetical protein T06_12620 [Trichinella sp. T6]|nr:hypothetical protein T06_12620 [Trichinella sp. T6]
MGLSTVIAIYRNRCQLTNFVPYMDTSSSCSSRKLIKRAASSALDLEIYTCGKVLTFSTELDIDNFVASSRWIRNFKSRHDIRELKIHGEKLSADSESAAKFTGQITLHNKQNVYFFSRV